jgi:hypothetical protein
MDKRKVKVQKTKQTNTYTILWRASSWTLELAKNEVEGSYYQIMASLIFTAFTLEAYLNHIGKKIFECWDDLERLSPAGKMNIIAEKLNIKSDNGKRPFQTVKKLLDFRNDVAHGKTITLSEEKFFQITDRNLDNYMQITFEPDWSQYCTLDNAEQARCDVKIIIEKFHRSADIQEDFLFHSGIEFSHATVLPEAE